MTGLRVRMSLKQFLSLLVPAVLLLAGCGYRLTSDPSLPSPLSGKKVAVPVFVNKSYRANVGVILAGSVVDEFARRTGGRVVGEDAADVILSGTVLSCSNTPISFTAADTVKEYRMLVTVEATLTEKSTRKVLWKGTLSWSQDYPVNTTVVVRQSSAVFRPVSSATNIALQQNSEDAAIRDISARLAQQIYERVTAGF